MFSISFLFKENAAERFDPMILMGRTVVMSRSSVAGNANKYKHGSASFSQLPISLHLLSAVQIPYFDAAFYCVLILFTHFSK